LEVALQLIDRPEIERSWAEPSALQQWSVGGLAGHLLRSSTTVIDYLEAETAPSGTSVAPAEYFAAAVDTGDLDSELHRSIRRRGEEMAAEGHADVVQRQQEAIGRLMNILADEPDDRRVRVAKGLVLKLDDYLVTRLVELAVHIDDLAVSVSIDPPTVPADALDSAIDALVETARHRHGDLQVLRALTRRERDEVNALRVF
jgi:hypothetical protein